MSRGELECKTCRWFDDFDSGTGLGTCKRYPEEIEKDEHDWCGEYNRHPAGGAFKNKGDGK